MAKKAAKKKAPTKSKKTAAKKPTPRRPRAARAPQSQALPGMEHVRYSELDASCEAIGAHRDRKNREAAKEAEAIDVAIEQMKARAVKVYKFAGVELAYIQGHDKLRVRLVKDKEGQGADAPGEQGDLGDADQE